MLLMAVSSLSLAWAAPVACEEWRVRSILDSLKECSRSRSLEAGRLIHRDVVDGGYACNTFIANTLMDMYAKCGSMEEARQVFEGMARRTVVSWSVVLLGYAQNGEAGVALELLERMAGEGVAPNAATFVAALKACCNKAGDGEDAGSRLARGRLVHLQALREGCCSDTMVANTLLDMYAKCGAMAEARCLFDAMPARTTVSWTVMINGYVAAGQPEAALRVFRGMQEDGCAPNAVTYVAALKACGELAASGAWARERCVAMVREIELAAGGLEGALEGAAAANTLMDAYGKCGRMEEAARVFEAAEGRRSVVTWTVMVRGYAENGEEARALEVYSRVRRGGGAGAAQGNAVTLVAALRAVAGLAEKEAGRQVGGRLVKAGSLEAGRGLHREAAAQGWAGEVAVCNALIDVYAKCGSMAEARGVFERLRRRGCDSVVTWTALILGYAENGEAARGVRMYRQMAAPPNAVALMAAAKACGGAGALEAGREVEWRARQVGMYEGERALGNTLVGMYGRCGSMGEAEAVFETMGKGAREDAVSWGALMTGYGAAGDVCGALRCLERMRREAVKPGGVVLLGLLSACSHAGDVATGEAVLRAMREEFGVEPGAEHYACVVDLLGRANRLAEAVRIVRDVPSLAANAVAWRSLLAASRRWKDVEVGKLAFQALLQLDQASAAVYVLLSDACA